MRAVATPLLDRFKDTQVWFGRLGSLRTAPASSLALLIARSEYGTHAMATPLLDRFKDTPTIRQIRHLHILVFKVFSLLPPFLPSDPTFLQSPPPSHPCRTEGLNQPRLLLHRPVYQNVQQKRIHLS